MRQQLKDVSIAILERRLAVMTHWSLFGAFGVGFLLSGFSAAQWGLGLLGYGLIMVGFVGHVVINQVYDTGFTAGEVALGLLVFGTSALAFVGNVLLVPNFSPVNLALGLSGFAAMVVSVALYLLIRYGTRGSWNMVHSLWHREGKSND
jgi:hypothetical protein